MTGFSNVKSITGGASPMSFIAEAKLLSKEGKVLLYLKSLGVSTGTADHK